jgi:hypothetical protein
MVSREARIRRLQRFLRKRRLYFVEVNGYAHEDRAISAHREREDGATVSNPEHRKLLGDIVDVLR